MAAIPPRPGQTILGPYVRAAHEVIIVLEHFSKGSETLTYIHAHVWLLSLSHPLTIRVATCRMQIYSRVNPLYSPRL